VRLDAALQPVEEVRLVDELRDLQFAPHRGAQRDGDAFTVHGGVRALHDRHDQRAIADEIAIVGYVVDSNLPRAPTCALHRTGRADPDGCVTELPSFTIADTKGATSGARIAVLGWASNFANLYEAWLRYKRGTRPATLWNDSLFGTAVPFPLPAVGAKVRVRGRYGVSFTKTSSGRAADPRNGVMTYAGIEYLEPAPGAVVLPK
jgi:hypothetical protein